jgi:quinoprotein glucose dehydrogenase
MLPLRLYPVALAAGFSILFSPPGARGAAPDPVSGPSSGYHTLVDPGTRQAAPEVDPASDEAQQAIRRMKLAPGLAVSLWAAEPMFANPVAFNFDEQGRIFVAETHRYRTSVLDIRDYLWMLEDDLASRTIEDRSALIAKAFGPAGVKELSLEGELLRVLEDRDHDGKADHSAIYADGFNTPLDGIASGVLVRRNEVWFANIPSLWKFTGHDRAETREELSRGYGVRFNFTGHDLHGLTFGPDGKIYFSIGDRGAHVPTKEGGVIDVPDTGAIFRCNPDGTHLEVFATGLRNPQDLLFTENGDLFTGDNDSDQGDEERLVHVVEGGDSGWRIGYQFAPRGNAGPWNRDKLWHPRFASQAAYIIPPICNIEDGPSGIAYYPGTGLNASYQGAIFITHFKGSVARSGIYAYKVKPRGATYTIADAQPLLTSSLPTDVKFGPDGRLYYSDWAQGWPKSRRGRIYAIFDPQHVNDPLVKETQALIASDYTKKSLKELAALLGHADWRVRLEAQYTLAERGDASLPTLTAVAQSTSAPPFARRHAIWGLGQLSAKNRTALAPLHALLHDADPEVRAQSIKVLGERFVAPSEKNSTASVSAELAEFVNALASDDSNRVKFFAAQSLGKLHRPDATPALLAALRANNDEDNYLRHACVMGLVGSDDLAALTTAISDRSRAVRMGVLLAFRRLGRAEIARFLDDSDPLLVREAALAINDAPIDAARPALAALLAHPIADRAVMLRAINAQFRSGKPENAEALATYAARADVPDTLRAEALAQLALWPRPPARDRLVGIFRPLPEKTRDAAVSRAALARVLPALLAVGVPEDVQLAALAATEALQLRSNNGLLIALLGDAQQPARSRVAALNLLDAFADPRLTASVAAAGASDSPELRLAALAIAGRLSPETAEPLLANLVVRGNVAEQKAAYRALGPLEHPAVAALLAGQLKKLADGKIAPEVQLELIDAAGKRSEPVVKTLLAQREARLAASGDALAPFRVALAGGDAKHGATIFNRQPVLACVRCHTVGASGEGGGDAGPNLAQIGARRSRDYLLEAVVKPSATIAPGFDTIVVTLKSGKTAAGIVADETADTLSLRTIDDKTIEVKKAEIAKREGLPSAMPEIYGAILSKSDLRDVVEFLATLTATPKASAKDETLRALRHWDD